MQSKGLSRGHIKTMFTVCHSKSLQGFKFLYVEGLPGLPNEIILNLFNRNHDKVLIGVMAWQSEMPPYRFLSILL